MIKTFPRIKTAISCSDRDARSSSGKEEEEEEMKT